MTNKAIVFDICFSVLLLVAILNICSTVVMRIRLTKREASGGKIVWWGRGSDEVASTYEALFPSSLLPSCYRGAFWLILVATMVLLIAILWK